MSTFFCKTWSESANVGKAADKVRGGIELNSESQKKIDGGERTC